MDLQGHVFVLQVLNHENIKVISHANGVYYGPALTLSYQDTAFYSSIHHFQSAVFYLYYLYFLQNIEYINR